MQLSKSETHRILENHKKWIRSNHVEGRKANLKNANMSYFKLDGINLSYVDLNSAWLVGTSLKNANISFCDFRHADLRNADLRNADLENSTFNHAVLDFCTLKNTNLNNTYLANVNLSGIDLTGIKNYFRNRIIRIELCKRYVELFTSKELAHLFLLFAANLKRETVKNEYSFVPLSIFKKLKDVGWGEYYDRLIIESVKDLFNSKIYNHLHGDIDNETKRIV